MSFSHGKIKKCCFGNCSKDATIWKGTLIKSRDVVEAGFCEDHIDTPCPNAYGKKGCYGIYHKGLGIIGKQSGTQLLNLADDTAQNPEFYGYDWLIDSEFDD